MNNTAQEKAGEAMSFTQRSLISSTAATTIRISGWIARTFWNAMFS